MDCGLKKLFSKFNKEKLAILDALKTQKPWQLSTDLHCQKNCMGCEILNFICPDRCINEIFLIDNQSYLMTETPMVSTPLNPFTVKVLLTWIVEDNIKVHAIQLIHVFQCQYMGYCLYRVPTVNNQLYSLESLINNKPLDGLIEGLFSQIVVIFNELKNISCHINAHYKSFLISDKPCDYLSGKKHIKCDYTIVLSDLSGASIHYFNNDIGVKKPTCLMPRMVEYKKSQFKMLYIGPLVVLDFYLMMQSLLSLPPWKEAFDKNEFLMSIDKSLWQRDIMDWLYINATEMALNQLK